MIYIKGESASIPEYINNIPEDRVKIFESLEEMYGSEEDDE